MKAQDPKYKHITRKALLEILMEEPNPDAIKDIVIDVESEIDEIDETYDAIKHNQLPLRKRMFLWKINRYMNDPEDRKPKVRTHLSLAHGTQKPEEIKNLIKLKYSRFIVGAYAIKVPSG